MKTKLMLILLSLFFTSCIPIGYVVNRDLNNMRIEALAMAVRSNEKCNEAKTAGTQKESELCEQADRDILLAALMHVKK